MSGELRKVLFDLLRIVAADVAEHRLAADDAVIADPFTVGEPVFVSDPVAGPIRPDRFDAAGVEMHEPDALPDPFPRPFMAEGQQVRTGGRRVAVGDPVFPVGEQEAAFDGVEIELAEPAFGLRGPGLVQVVETRIVENGEVEFFPVRADVGHVQTPAGFEFIQLPESPGVKIHAVKPAFVTEIRFRPHRIDAAGEEARLLLPGRRKVGDGFMTVVGEVEAMEIEAFAAVGGEPRAGGPDRTSPDS